MGLEVRLQKAVNGFALDVAWKIGDELAVLFGFSGAGKTMTLQMIAGLIKPDKGLVRLDDTVYFDSSAKTDLPPQARPFGYVFQDLALFPHMTVMENILYGAATIPKNERPGMARELVGTFRLAGLEDRYPGEISGGQRQRAAFARALMRRPTALLLDEPFSALDRPLRREMGRFLKDVRAGFDIPVVLVTHDFEEACSLADRMIVYEQGRVVQAGAPQEVNNCAILKNVSGTPCDNHAPRRSSTRMGGNPGARRQRPAYPSAGSL